MLSPDEIRTKNQRTILMLIGAFILPVVMAYIVYINSTGVGRTKNHGELITPARPLVGLNLTTLDGKPYTVAELKGSWHLIYIGKDKCDQSCSDSLSKMHQSRLAQGKAMSRLGLIYITSAAPDSRTVDALAKKISHLTIATYKPESVAKLKTQFASHSQDDVLGANRIYMVDPLGNLMMQYKSDVTLIGIIKDLEHLMRISQVG